MPKRTYKPSKKKRLNKHGFRHRLKTAIKIIKRRRNKGRNKMAPKPMTTKKRYK